MGKPKIRFKGFDDDWEQRKLSDIYGSIGNAFVGTATPYYAEQGHFYLESNNVKDGQINHNSEIFINDEFYEKQKDKWLHTGDMVMVQSGHVGHAAVIPEELDNTAAHALIMFRNPKEEIEPYFLNYEYQTDKAKKKIDNITTGNTIKHILASDMQEFVVDVPKSEEQKVIAGYFCNIDHLITLHQRKCDETKKLKKYMLQKMFPQSGQTVPEIRFSGFTDVWEQRKLGDVLERRIEQRQQSKEYPRLAFASGQGVIPLSERKTNNREQLTKDEYTKKYLVTELNDIVYNPANVKYGAIDRNKCGRGLISPIYVTFTTSEISGFIERIVTSHDFQQRALRFEEGTVTKRQSVNPEDLVTLDILVASKREEQQKIATYFDSLDNLITLHQQKCDELRNIKKFMLQNMFA